MTVERKSPGSARQHNERNIYVQYRSGAYRFRVEVYPLRIRTRTFESVAQGIAWARRARAELLEQKRRIRLSSDEAGSFAGDPPEPPVEVVLAMPLAEHRLLAMLEHYQRLVVPNLSDAVGSGARVRNLQRWFGALTLGQLTLTVLEQWLTDRLAGKLGSGQAQFSRGAPPGVARLTKDQRYRMRKSGKAPQEETASRPVSPQSARHELMYLRRAIKRYCSDHGLLHEHGSWLGVQPVMTMPLPEQSRARTRRLDDNALLRIIAAMRSGPARHAVLLALVTSLRRSEVVSLQWEDVDFERRIVHLRAPGYRGRRGVASPSRPSKTKTEPREVPLTEDAIFLLRKMGVRSFGPLIDLSPQAVTSAWVRASDRAGVPNARFHDVRRESLTRLLEQFDLPLSLLTLFSGHRDVATLQKHYLQPSAQKLAQRLAGERMLDDCLFLEEQGHASGVPGA